VAFLSGEAANIIFEKSDEEIVSMCVDSLRKVFPEEVTNKQLYVDLLISILTAGSPYRPDMRQFFLTAAPTVFVRLS